MLALPLYVAVECSLASPRARPPLPPPPRTSQGTSSALKPSSTIDRGNAGAEPIAAVPSPLPASHAWREVLGLQCTDLAHRDRLHKREREKREGRGQYCLPHRRCMDVQLIRPLLPFPSLPLPPLHSSVLLTLLFVLHLAPEHRGGALASSPALSHSLQEEGEEREDEERRRRRRRRAPSSPPPPPFGYIRAGGIHGRADGRGRTEGRTPGRTRGEAVWPKRTHPPRPPWEERERAPRLKTDRASGVGRPMNEGESPARRRMGTTRRKGRRGGIVGR